MLVIILRGIDVGVNGNLAGICLKVFNKKVALDIGIFYSYLQLVTCTVKGSAAINRLVVCALTLNRQALHLIVPAEQLLRFAGFNCQIICSDTCSRCSLHYDAIGIQLQAVVSTVHCNAAAAKCDIAISCGNYAISASHQRAAVQVNVVTCSDVACTIRGNAAGCYVHIFTCVDIAYAACSNSTCVQVNVIACSDVACAGRGNAAGCYIHIIICVDIACAACFNSTCVQVNVVTVNSYIATCVDDSVTCAVTEVYVAVQVELSISFSSNAVNYQARISLACALQVNRTVVCLSVNHSAVFQNTDTVISFADIAVGCLQVNAVGV